MSKPKRIEINNKPVWAPASLFLPTQEVKCPACKESYFDDHEYQKCPYCQHVFSVKTQA